MTVLTIALLCLLVVQSQQYQGSGTFRAAVYEHVYIKANAYNSNEAMKIKQKSLDVYESQMKIAHSKVS